MKPFFNPLRHKIEDYVNFANKYLDDGSFYAKKIKLSGAFLNEILQRAQLYEEHIQFNIENISHTLTNGLQNKNFSEPDVDDIIIFLVRAAKEFEITSETTLAPAGSALLEYFVQYLNNQISNDELFNGQIYYAFNQMPFHILKYKNTNALKELEDKLPDTIEKILSSKLANKNDEATKLQAYIDRLIEQLKEKKQEFSFVSLNRAFSALSERKEDSKRNSLTILGLFGFLIVAFPMFELFYLHDKTINYYVLTALIFIESIFIYFFRITLHKYNSLTDQIVQLETKQAIMQFIESYVDYKKDKGLKNEDTEKFDEIIFSRISPNLKDIPDHPNIVSIVEAFSKAIKK